MQLLGAGHTVKSCRVEGRAGFCQGELEPNIFKWGGGPSHESKEMDAKVFF